MNIQSQTSSSSASPRFAIGLLLAAACLFPAWCSVAQASLDDDLQTLYAKYGKDSVVRKVARDNPPPSSSETVGPDALTSKNEQVDVTGLHLFSGQPFRLLIRRTYGEVTATEDPSISDPKAFSKTEGAQFAYSHDYLVHSDQWSVIAAIITPFELARRTGEPAPYEGLKLQLLEFVPSISLNRVTNDVDSTKEVDELLFRAGLFSQWLGAVGPIRLLNLSGYATYARDTGFHHGGIIAGEVDLEPITNLPGNRTFYRLIGEPNDKDRKHAILEFFWRARLHSEFGAHTATSGPADDDFFRIGPTVGLKLDPFFLQRLNASLDYSYLVGVAGHVNNSHHLLAKIGFILDSSPETDHWTLNATYEDGDTPLVQNRVRTFLLSLGVKY